MPGRRFSSTAQNSNVDSAVCPDDRQPFAGSTVKELRQVPGMLSELGSHLRPSLIGGLRNHIVEQRCREKLKPLTKHIKHWRRVLKNTFNLLLIITIPCRLEWCASLSENNLNDFSASADHSVNVMPKLSEVIMPCPSAYCLQVTFSGLKALCTW